MRNRKFKNGCGILCALFLMLPLESSAKSHKSFDLPHYVYGSNSQVSMRSVEFADTATVVSFGITGAPYSYVRLPKDIVACGEDGKKYGMRGIYGLAADGKLWMKSDGKAEFKVSFKSLPTNTECFDILSGYDDDRLCFLGVHDKGGKLKIKAAKEAVDNSEVSADAYTRGTAVILGTVSKPSCDGKLWFAECFFRPFMQQADFSGEATPLVAEIDEDGRFELKMDIDCPMYSQFSVRSGGETAHVPFYVRPGDTLRIDLAGEGTEYRSSNSKGCFDNLLRNGIAPIWFRFGQELRYMNEENVMTAMEVFLDSTMRVCDYVAGKYSLSPWETHVMKTGQRLSVLNSFFYGMNSVRHYRERAVREGMMDERDSRNDFAIVRKMPVDDPTVLLFGEMLENAAGSLMMSELFRNNDSPQASVGRMNELLGYKESAPLFMQAALTTRMKSVWQSGKDETSQINSLISSNYLRHKAEDMKTEVVSVRNSDAYDVPQNPGGDILRRHTDKYNGKYVELVLITGENSGRNLIGNKMVNLIPDFHASKDIQFVYLFDGNAFTSDEYARFADGSLRGEDTHRISGDDFAELRKTLHFIEGPKVCTLNREGKIMRQPLFLNDETAFRMSLRTLLENERM
ncbi:MAG: hypothetical protein NC206_08615 [Bacteroides sp.]|nr:hypothetical protein [Roseburia sp.]MCM1347132.1 hypothetical protein [Bacteroides sp.]MCM1421631.1 hypothetical protein [Bacteroides sp.]